MVAASPASFQPSKAAISSGSRSGERRYQVTWSREAIASAPYRRGGGPSPRISAPGDGGERRSRVDGVALGLDHALLAQGRVRSSSSSRSSPRAASTASSPRSVAASMASRAARPGVGDGLAVEKAAVLQPGDGGRPLLVGEAAGRRVGVEGDAPPELGEQGDLDGVDAPGDPGRVVGVAPVLAQEVGGPPRSPTGSPGQPWDRRPAWIGWPLAAVRLAGLAEQLGGPLDAVGQVARRWPR